MGRNLAAIYGLMGPMGNQLQFLLASPAHSLLLSMFLNLSSSTLAKSTSLIPSIHLYPSSSSLPHLYFLFLPHQSTLYSPLSPPPLSKAIPDVAVRAPIAFCHFFQPPLQEVGPFGKRKEERRKRVIGFRGALREGRPKSTTRTLTSHTTCVHGFKRRRALMHPHTDNIFYAALFCRHALVFFFYGSVFPSTLAVPITSLSGSPLLKGQKEGAGRGREMRGKGFSFGEMC